MPTRTFHLMTHPLVRTAIVVPVVLLTQSARGAPAEGLEFHHHKNGTLYFAKSHPSNQHPSPLGARSPSSKRSSAGNSSSEGDSLLAYPSELTQVRYIGKLQPVGSAPYFLFSGIRHASSDDKSLSPELPHAQSDLEIHIVRPQTSERMASFIFPGVITDPKTGHILYRSQAFHGRCLPNRPEMYLVFQDEKVDRRKHLQASVLQVEAAVEHLDERLIERRLPSLAQVHSRVRAKQCFVIPGHTRRAPSAPLEHYMKGPQEKMNLETVSWADDAPTGNEASASPSDEGRDPNTRDDPAAESSDSAD